MSPSKRKTDLQMPPPLPKKRATQGTETIEEIDEESDEDNESDEEDTKMPARKEETNSTGIAKEGVDESRATLEGD